MKIPTIFRTPRHQQFRIVPRYYDPVKEEIEERTARIKGEIGMNDSSQPYQYQSRISGGFSKRHAKGRDYTGLRQFAIMLLLVAAAVGYLQYGNKVFYGLMVLFPVYLFLRLKKAI